MELVKLTDFVFHQDFGFGNDLITEKEFRQKVTAYARFLKQPLTLGMFVACDDDGNVLIFEKSEYEINADKNNWCRFISKEEAKYQQAKEKVLFLNFDSEPFDVSLAKVYMDEFFNVEQLSFGIRGLQLTASALKQIRV